MANSKMIDALRKLSEEDKINPNTFNQLMASAIADLYEKMDEMQETCITECKSRSVNFTRICDDIKTMESSVSTLQIDTQRIKNRLDNNPAIQWGEFVEKHPTAVKFVIGLTLLFVAGNGIQVLIDLTKTILGY